MQIVWSRPDNFTGKTDRKALVAYSNFNSNNHQVEFNANNPDNENDNARGRASEQAYLLYTLNCLEPPTKHSADFCKISLKLKKPGFIHKFKL